MYCKTYLNAHKKYTNIGKSHMFDDSLRHIGFTIIPNNQMKYITGFREKTIDREQIHIHSINLQIHTYMRHTHT